MPRQFFYDASTRQWILQVMRIFSGYQYESIDGNGNTSYSTIPCIWGDSTFNAATIARMNSTNMLPTFPLFSLYIHNLRYDPSRRQNPTYQDEKQVRTRAKDENGNYLPQQGNAYTVTRMMPTPYLMTIRVDLVTTNTTQKLQVLEQMLPYFNPMMEIQKNDNYMDWESLSTITLMDITWTDRTIPTGTGNDPTYDVCSLEFEVPIWFSFPAKVSKQGVVFKVIADLQSASTDPYLNDLMLGTRQVITYQQYGIYVNGSSIYLLKQGETSLTGEPLDWSGTLAAYGKIVNGVSEISLDYGGTTPITGTITLDPTNSTNLLFDVNEATLPSDTLPPVSGIVNPQQMAPGAGMPIAEAGTSYLVTGDIGSEWPAQNGYPASAKKNDIITFNGSEWTVTFVSSESSLAFVTNTSTQMQYKWNGKNWSDSWKGPYSASEWSLIL